MNEEPFVDTDGRARQWIVKDGAPMKVAAPLCFYEGHQWRGGGQCVACGEQLRCMLCGRFTTERALSDHMRDHHQALGEGR